MERVKTYKIIIIGDPAVGKTSLRKRYMGSGFKQTYQVTIGADFAVKRMTIDDQQYLFQIWDLSAQVAFKSIRSIYYKNTDGVMLTFDLTSQTSLHNIPNWVKEFQKNRLTGKVPAILVGNKSDLVSNNDVDYDEIKYVRNKINGKFESDVNLIQTSALSAENVDEAFTSLIKMLTNTSDDIIV